MFTAAQRRFPSARGHVNEGPTGLGIGEMGPVGVWERRSPGSDSGRCRGFSGVWAYVCRTKIVAHSNSSCQAAAFARWLGLVGLGACLAA